jgi:GNAT superfamily N-acetyltransferase
MSEYTIRPVGTGDAEIATMAALLRVVFPDAQHFTEDVLRWQYRDNPDGQVVGMNAWQGEELAAHYVTIPLVARVNGVEEKGLLSLNTATHPAHQGKGLFTKLANATYALGAERGFGFVVGVANANSTHGFTKKLGFQLVSPLRAMIGVGALPLATGHKVDYERVWSPAALAWRLAHPAYAYRFKRTKDLTLILSMRRQMGARYVMGAYPGRTADGLVPPEAGSVVRKVWIGLDPDMRWVASPYINIPMRFRPSPLNLIWRDLTGKARLLDPATVRFQAMDFDIL